MKRLREFYGTAVGKKMVVAGTGLLLFLFLVGHVLGNLKAFMGFADDGVPALDHYAEFLRTFLEDALGYGVALWIARIVLLGAFVLHIVTVLLLQAQNRRARPIGYRAQQYRASTVASRTMLVGGLVLLGFTVYHILHMTTGTLHSSFVPGRVYHNIYVAFQNPFVLVIYLVSMVALGFHLYHGIWSMLQTLGLDNPDRNRLFTMSAKAGSVLIAGGFMVVPIAIFVGLLPHPLH